MVLLACAAGCKKETGDGAGQASAAAALSEYQRKSMATEAIASVKMMAAGASAYAADEHMEQGSMAPVTGKLPPSAPLTPEAGACCKTPSKKCDPNSELWKHPTWQALGFQVSDPHRYSYEFVSTPEGFTARAVGDLDCDGTTSLYEVYGTFGDGEHAEKGTIQISGGIYKERPLE